jgi:pimeloyl-ACP methyl ester carboxylesterase
MSIAKKKASYAALIYREDLQWTEISSGGHFAALEQPELMLADLRAFVSTIVRGGFHA